MTSRLRAALEDLADDAPTAPDFAARAWAAGRVRRRRRLGVSVLAAAATVATVILLVPMSLNSGNETPTSGAGRDGVDHYPQRVGYWRTPSPLPDKPGPLAGTLLNNNGGNAYPIGVNSAGKIWRLNPGFAALSPDGRLLLETEPGREEEPRAIRLHDLTTGTHQRFDEIGDDYYGSGRNYNGRQFTYRVDSHEAVSWSPDQASVLVKATERSHPNRHLPVVLDVNTGALTPLGAGSPAGFRSASEPVTVGKPAGRTAKGGIAVTTTDLRTAATNVLLLQLDRPWSSGYLGLSASISPDGSTLMLIEGSSTLRMFSMRDGREKASRSVPNVDCITNAWLGEDPVLSTKKTGSPARLMQVTPDGSRSLVAMHQRLQSRCIRWVADALEGGPSWSLFGQSTAWWTWYWQILLPLVAVPIAVLLLTWRRRQRRKPKPQGR